MDRERKETAYANIEKEVYSEWKKYQEKCPSREKVCEINRRYCCVENCTPWHFKK